jgi:5-aminolevulinate synthase
MLDYEGIFTEAIEKVVNEGRYRVFTDIDYSALQSPRAISKRFNREITVWCSNDYLGMSQHPEVKQAAVDAVIAHGAGTGGTRNISGTNSLIIQLEDMMADLHGKQSGLVFTSGYVANQAVLSTLGKVMPEVVIYSDEMNHASMIEGIRHSNAERHVFRHSDMEHLEELLAQQPLERPKLIAFESVYSMLGDISPMHAICTLAKRYNAITYLDEVHSVGLYGVGGAGVAEMLGVASQIDVIQGTFAKAYGVIGGYIAASNKFVDAIRSHAPGFIFTTSLPPAVCAAAIASVAHLRSSDVERLRHQKMVKYVKDRLLNVGIELLENNTHIVPVIVGNPNIARQISEMMMSDFGVYVQHINFPTVPRGTERLRITPTPLHTVEMAEKLITALESALQQHGIYNGRKVA